MKRFTAQFLMTVILISLGSAAIFAQKRNEPKKLREVNIYLLREAGDDDVSDPNNPLGLFPVKRRVAASDALASSLRLLTKGATREEERQKYHSSTFGMRFVSVSLRNGQAVARFFFPETASFSGDLGPDIFEEAVRKTAMQFKEVKKVVVCQVSKGRQKC